MTDEQFHAAVELLTDHAETVKDRGRTFNDGLWL